MSPLASDSADRMVRQLLGRHTEVVLKSATTAVRAVALVVIVVSMFLGPTAHGATRTVQLVCLAVGIVTVLAWGVIAWRPTPHPAALILVLAVMAASSAAATSAHGGALVSFAILAAVAAGAASGLAGSWAVAGIGVLAVVTGAIAVGATPVSALGSCLEVVVALLLGRSRQAYRIQADQAALLLAQADLLRAEQSQVATLSERSRIAREIHDVLAHSLGALGIQIQAARALLSEQQDADRALTVLDRAQRIASEGLDETRRAVHALRTDTRPLDEELAALATDHQVLHGVPVELEIIGTKRPLPPDATLALLRTGQESLVNAAKHSPGQPIALELTYADTETNLQVTNRLGGAAAPDIETLDGGYGLRGMRERLLLLHGSLTASARAGRWEVVAQVPR